MGLRKSKRRSRGREDVNLLTGGTDRWCAGFSARGEGPRVGSSLTVLVGPGSKPPPLGGYRLVEKQSPVGGRPLPQP